MPNDVHHIQIRSSKEMREKILALAKRHKRSTADIVRSSLDIGIRILTKLLEAQSEMVDEYVAMLKKEARGR